MAELPSPKPLVSGFPDSITVSALSSYTITVATVVWIISIAWAWKWEFLVNFTVLEYCPSL